MSKTLRNEKTNRVRKPKHYTADELMQEFYGSLWGAK
jgi:hypothetical protein